MVVMVSDTIRVKFVQLAAIDHLVDPGIVTCRWISELEAVFEMSDKIRARLAVCIADLVDESVVQSNQHFRQ